MRPLILSLAALVLVTVSPTLVDAQIFGRRRPQVVNQINIGGGGQQFVAPQQRLSYGQIQALKRQQAIAAYNARLQQRQKYYVPAQQAVAYVQPVVTYVQPQAVVIEKQYFQQQQAYGCQGGGLQLNSCQSFFSY